MSGHDHAEVDENINIQAVHSDTTDKWRGGGYDSIHNNMNMCYVPERPCLIYTVYVYNLVCMCMCVVSDNYIIVVSDVNGSGTNQNIHVLIFLTWVIRGNVLIYRVDTMKISPYRHRQVHLFQGQHFTYYRTY